MIHPWHILECKPNVDEFLENWRRSTILPQDCWDKCILKDLSGLVPDATVESGTILKGPCYIGSNSYVGNNALIRNYSAIGPDSIVGYGSELKNCVLFGKNDVGRLSFIGDSVMGEGV